MANRCPRCGNEYPSWSPSTCRVCARNDHDNRISGGRERRPIPKPYGRIPGIKYANKTPFKSSITRGYEKNKQQSEGIRSKYDKQEIHNCIVSYNKLLYDVYGKSTRLSTVLERRKLSHRKIRRLQRNMNELGDMLTRLDNNLMRLFIEIMPKDIATEIFKGYGLNFPARFTNSRLHTPPMPSNRVRREVRRYLAKGHARKRFELTIYKTARIIEWLR